MQEKPNLIPQCLVIAIKNGELDKVKELIEENQNLVNSLDKNGLTPLHGAIAEKKPNIAQYLITNGANVNAITDKGGQTPAHLAAFIECEDCMELLIKNGANVNCKRKHEDGTPLHIAAFNGHIKVVKCLIDHGADINAKTKDGKTALDICKDSETKQIIQDELEYRKTVKGFIHREMQGIYNCVKRNVTCNKAIALTTAIAACAFGYGLKSGAIKINGNVISDMLDSIGKATGLSR